MTSFPPLFPFFPPFYRKLFCDYIILIAACQGAKRVLSLQDKASMTRSAKLFVDPLPPRSLWLTMTRPEIIDSWRGIQDRIKAAVLGGHTQESLRNISKGGARESSRAHEGIPLFGIRFGKAGMEHWSSGVTHRQQRIHPA